MGVEVSLYTFTSNEHARLSNLLEVLNVDLVLDVGANEGQSGVFFRKTIGYRGQILSFEPLQDAFLELERKSQNDSAWSVFNFGLGNEEKKVEINVSGNSQSSSILAINKIHEHAAPGSKYQKREVISLKPINSCLPFEHRKNNIFLKIDTQGFELEVLKGCGDIMNNVKLCMLEMSTVELYENGPILPEIIHFMYENGFVLSGVKSGLSNPETGQLLQCDGLFMRNPT